MSDDWLDRGHGADGSRLATVFGRTPSDSSEVDGAGAGSHSAWLAAPVSLAIVALVVVVGSAGAVYAIRESLFPNLGAPTSASVWRSPASPTEPEPAPPTVPRSTTTPPTTTATTTTAPVERTVTIGPDTTIERGDDSKNSGTSNSGSGSGNSGFGVRQLRVGFGRLGYVQLGFGVRQLRVGFGRLGYVQLGFGVRQLRVEVRTTRVPSNSDPATRVRVGNSGSDSDTGFGNSGSGSGGSGSGLG